MQQYPHWGTEINQLGINNHQYSSVPLLHCEWETYRGARCTLAPPQHLHDCGLLVLQVVSEAVDERAQVMWLYHQHLMQHTRVIMHKEVTQGTQSGAMQGGRGSVSWDMPYLAVRVRHHREWGQHRGADVRRRRRCWCTINDGVHQRIGSEGSEGPSTGLVTGSSGGAGGSSGWSRTTTATAAGPRTSAG